MKNLLQKDEKKEEPEQAVPCDHKTASRCLLNLMPVVSETVSGTLLNGTFLPDICLEVVHERAFSKLPFAKTSLTVVLFADISGFTALTETYSLTGALGIEALTRTLNHFFGHIIQHIFSAGGDIFKFAGDAIFCIWKVDDESTLAETIQTVVDCSLNIQKNYGEWPTCIGVTLRVKIGIATGKLEYHFFNDEFDSVHYSASGTVVEYVRNAEMLCSAGDIILTTESWGYLEKKGVHTRYTYTALPEDMVKVLCFDPGVSEEEKVSFTSAFAGVRPALYALNFEDAPLLKRFISPVVVNIKTQEELIFLSEMRHVTIVFICMPDFIDIDLATLSALYKIVSAALKETDGVLNKVITFDKGCSFLAVFGLPGYKGKNETCNALMCCNKLVHEITAMKIKTTAGITSGMTFCGIIGHPLRQEYTVIGRKVNLAARLMSKYSDYLMVCDEDTYQRSVLLMGQNNFKELEWRKLKGIEHMGRVFEVKISTEEEVMDEIADYKDPVMGMTHEREQIETFLMDFLTKRRMPKHMILLRGETGCGKSHLLCSTVKTAAKRGFKSGTCHASVRTMRNPFSAVCFLLSRLLDSYGLNPHQENNTILEDILGTDSSTPLVINKGIIRLKNAAALRLATAGSMADVSWQNKSVAQAKDHLIAITESLCTKAPCILAVDDANYMDTLSWELLDKFGQLTSQYPCVVALTSIPHSERVQQPLQIQKIMAKAVSIVDIQPLSKEYIPDFCFQRIQVKGIHNQILRLLKEYTKGNPAAMVEILQVLKQKNLIHNVNSTTTPEVRLKREFTLAREDEHELREHRPGEGFAICDVVGEGLMDDVQVPDSLQALTVVRMEMLNEQEIVLLKKASVCGKTFETSLLKLLSPTITTAEINGAIKKLVEQHFITCSANTTTTFVYLLEGKVQDAPECPQCGQVGSLMRFHSAAVHKTIYATLTYDSKAEIHQDIATCLEENALQCRFCKEYLSVEVYTAATDEFLMQSPPDKADLRVCKCHKMKASAYGQIGNHYFMSGMRGRALEAFLSATQCSLEVDDVKKAEEYLESSENVFKASSWENVDERYLKLKRIAISRMRATIQLYYGNIDASLQEIKLAFQWLGRNIPKDYRKNAANYALRVVQCCRVDEIEEEEFCLNTAARVFLNRRDPRVALDVSSHFWELVTCRNAPLYKKMPAISLVIESSHYVHIAYKKQKKLEDTAIKDCIHALEVEKHPRVSDLVAVLNTLIKIVEVRFLRTEIASAVDVGYEAFRIALSVHYTSMLLKILPYLAQTLLYSKNHSKCREVLSHLRHVAEVAEDTVGMALYYGGLAELLVHQFGIDVPALDNVQERYKTCLEFAISQCSKAPYTNNNEIEFYLTAAMAMWTSSCGLDQSCKEWLRRAKELKRSFHWRSSYWGRRAQRHLSEIKWK